MTTLTINIDKNLKKGVQKRVKKEGLTLTALISQFFKSYLKGEWELQLTPPTKQLLEAIREADEEIRSGKAKLYDNVDKMFNDILNEPDEV